MVETATARGNALPTYRSIVLRVATAALAVAVAVGGAAFLVEMEIVDDRVSAIAARQAEEFLGERPRMLLRDHAGAALDSALVEFMHARRANADGQFIVAEIYDRDRVKLTEHVLEGFDWAEDHLRRYSHDFPAQGQTWYRRLFVDGTVLIQTMTPLSGAGGELLGYFEGVYQLSSQRSDEIVDDTMMMVAASVLAVLATALVLLPIFTGFNAGAMRLSRQLLLANVDTLSVLGGTIAKRDSDTHTHNYRVTVLAIRLAEALGLEPAATRSLIKGAFLHDVGKIGIPDHILLKPGRLDPDEFTVMKSHVLHGLDIVSRSAWLADAKDVVGCHHEKFDGSGYPAGAVGQDIPVNARIFAIVDVFDALTSKRPYKEPIPFDKAMAILDEGKGSHFDPALLTAFAGIARDLHATLAAMADREVEEHMRGLVARYFGLG